MITCKLTTHLAFSMLKPTAGILPMECAKATVLQGKRTNVDPRPMLPSSKLSTAPLSVKACDPRKLVLQSQDEALPSESQSWQC